MTSGAPLGICIARLSAEVLGLRASIENSFDDSPDEERYWGTVDLVNSVNSRHVRGARDAFLRAEFLNAMAAAVVRCTAAVRIVKDLGDAVFLTSTDGVELLEAVLLLQEGVHSLRESTASDYYPFAARGAISVGRAKRLRRRHEDWVGEPIDMLFRLMSAKSEASDLFVEEEAFERLDTWVGAARSFLVASDMMSLRAGKADKMLKGIYYRELRIDRAALHSSDGLFGAWRAALGAKRRET